MSQEFATSVIYQLAEMTGLEVNDVTFFERHEGRPALCSFVRAILTDGQSGVYIGIALDPDVSEFNMEELANKIRQKFGNLPPVGKHTKIQFYEPDTISTMPGEAVALSTITSIQEGGCRLCGATISNIWHGFNVVPAGIYESAGEVLRLSGPWICEVCHKKREEELNENRKRTV